MHEPATKTDLRRAESKLAYNVLLMIGYTAILAAAIILA